MKLVRILLSAACLVLLLPGALCAEWILAPDTVAVGEVAIVRWVGDSAPENAVGRFNAKPFYFEQATDGGLFALIGVDINTRPGIYMVAVVSIGTGKSERSLYMPLHVIDKDRGVDRLQLAPEMVTPTRKKTEKRIGKESALLKEIFSRHDGPLLAEPFRLPVDDKVSSVFGKRRILNGEPRSPHSGVDFRSPRGRKVKAPARGRVVYSGDLYYTGRTVILDHGAGLYSLYAHLETSKVQVGQMLKQGQVLGLVGSSGRSTGAHLHWTVRLRDARVDPMSLWERYGTDSP